MHPGLKQHCPNVLCNCVTLTNKFVVSLFLKVCLYSHGIPLELVLILLLNTRRGSLAKGAGVKKWEGRRLFQINLCDWMGIQKPVVLPKQTPVGWPQLTQPKSNFHC